MVRYWLKVSYFYYMVKVSKVLLVAVFCKGYLRPFKATRIIHMAIDSHSDSRRLS